MLAFTGSGSHFIRLVVIKRHVAEHCNDCESYVAALASLTPHCHQHVNLAPVALPRSVLYVITHDALWSGVTKIASGNFPNTWQPFVELLIESACPAGLGRIASALTTWCTIYVLSVGNYLCFMVAQQLNMDIGQMWLCRSGGMRFGVMSDFV